MRLKWQWFTGGKVMFWLALILIVVLVIGFTTNYVINPTEISYMTRSANINSDLIQEISENYLNELRYNC